MYLVIAGLIASCNTQNELELNTLSNEAIFAGVCLKLSESSKLSES